MKEISTSGFLRGCENQQLFSNIGAWKPQVLKHWPDYVLSQVQGINHGHPSVMDGQLDHLLVEYSIN